MVNRVYNFNAGPATLPLKVLEKAQQEFLDYRGTGMSILESSHRAKEFDDIINDANVLLKEVFNVPGEYKVLWLQGGASTQFYMMPSNIMRESADYVNTGVWSKKAIKEAKLYGKVNVVASSEDKNFSYIPKNIQFNDDASYAHISSNNTIFGTQWQKYPKTGDVPLICDMSSDFLSREVDIKNFGIIYAGAQKNLGPAGVTAVIIREDIIENSHENIPTMLKYKTHVNKNSMFNTPPCFAIYLCKLALEHMKSTGGIKEIEKKNEKKAKLIYNVIDKSEGFYKPHAQKDSRSLMNITFRLPSEELERKCFEEAKAKKLIGVKGHRSVGGMRASIYNAMTVEGSEKLAEFLTEFKEKNMEV